MKTLDEIALGTTTDKSPAFHAYTPTYDTLFSSLRDTPIRLLEMGVLSGNSIKMWAQYFAHPETRIVGIDIHTDWCHPIDDPRVSIIEASQTDADFFAGLEPQDIIIDDAGHFASAQIEAFRLAWPLVKPGGWYVVEDLHTYAAPELCDAPENLMQFLTRLATEMQGRGAMASGKVDASDQWASIDTLTFRKGLCLIRKA